MLNARPPSTGRWDFHGSPSFQKKSSKKENTGTVTDQRPCFYRIILNDEPMMRFPSQFMNHISKELSDTATLRVVSGGLWTVKVKMIGNDVFMEEGWVEFVRKNSLRDHHFLLFKYDGNMRFSVNIFDPSGVEKIGISSIRMPQESAGISIGKRPRGRPRKNPVDALNRQHNPLNSSGEGSDQGLTSHKSKKPTATQRNDKFRRLKTTEKGRNVKALLRETKS